MHTLRSILPLFGIFALMIIGALLTDGVLHLFDRVSWGRYLGYLGTAILLISFVYSARKRKWLTWGKPMSYLRLHEFLSWLGAMMILVHGGVHYNALLPWLAMVAMLVAVASGLTGKYLLQHAREVMTRKKAELTENALSGQELEDALYWDSLLFEWMKKWRVIHLPITTLFFFLAFLHIVSILLFWEW